MTVKTGENTSTQIRLEPEVGGTGQVFYDLNYSWGSADKAYTEAPISAIEQLELSAELGSGLVSRIASIGATK